MELTKHHGLGNDFLIAVQPKRALDLTDAIGWCDRKRGIGADGLLELRSLSAAGNGTPALWAMTLWNADGGEAEVSGNGLRCVGQALAMYEGITGSCSFLVRTGGGIRRVDVEPDRRGPTHNVRVEMGSATAGLEVSDRWGELGVEVNQQIGVSIGNPHLVALVDQPEALDLRVVGPIVESDYPAGINVHAVRVDSPTSLTLRVWERGAGITEACGSGACAAAWATQQWGLTEAEVEVKMPGGLATVQIGSGEESNSIHLVGPATFVGRVILGE